jgi:RND family efflux transporter MFP subunit
MNRTRNTIIILAGLAVVIIGAVALGRHQDAKPIEASMITVKRSSFSVKLPETGVVMNPATITVPTLIAGNVDRIYVKAGAHVTAGELLATVVNPTLLYNAASSEADYTNAVANVTTARINEKNARVQYQASVDTNKSALDEARRVYDADAALLAQKAIARSTVDADKAKLDQAQVAYDQAVEQLRLGAVTGYGMDSVQAAQANAEKTKIINQQNQQQVAFTRITAPIGGVVQTVATQTSDSLRSLQEGDAVTEGQELFTIASDEGFIVKAQVDEQDIFNVGVGQYVEITSDDFPGKTVPGHVRSIAPVAIKSTDPSSTAKQVLVTIALDQTPAFLKDGLTVDVDIHTTDIARALTVPSAALRKEGKKSFVFVNRGGKAMKTYVSVGLSNDTQTIVSKGLSLGEQVITDKNPEIVAGSAVKPAPSPSPPTSGGSSSIVIGG